MLPGSAGPVEIHGLRFQASVNSFLGADFDAPGVRDARPGHLDIDQVAVLAFVARWNRFAAHAP